jgi:hypothetical protein
MWKIEEYYEKQKGNKYFQILNDDIEFAAILKRGPTFHENRKSLVKCMHIIPRYDVDEETYEMSEEDKRKKEEQGYLNFYMSVLEATKIEAKYPEFYEDGLMGKWKLIAPSTGNHPTIKLVEYFSDVYEFFKCANNEVNPNWVKNSYTFHEHLFNPK